MSAPAREVLSEDLAAITRGATLTRGLGRSYGDAPLPGAGIESVAGCGLADRLLAFDRETGVVRAEAGLSLRDLNRVLLPAGYFPPVVPGTQFVTLGGMVAADVHGKNHHVAGTFGRHVRWLRMRLADDSIVECSRTQNAELFLATLGGMGLTGHVLEVEFQAERVPSPWLIGEGRRAANIEQFLTALAEEAPRWPFTVGWIDCLSKGPQLGRGVLWCGRWARRDEAPPHLPKRPLQVTMPFHLPSWTLGPWSVRVFNEILFRGWSLSRKLVDPEAFFFPLDRILHWNRLYGRSGMTQFQCVLPEKDAPGSTRRFLEVLSNAGGASPLCVIKDCGEEGEGRLSFPRPGVSVAVDLPVRRDTREVIDRLSRATIDAGGRIYLAKDGWVKREHFRTMEPRLGSFLEAKRSVDPEGRLRSAQFERLMEEKE